MMKKLILNAVIIFVGLSVHAQKKSGSGTGHKEMFSIGMEGSFPAGNFTDRYKFGKGGSARICFKTSPVFAISLNAGYISYPGKRASYSDGAISDSFRYETAGFIPVLAGVKYNFGHSLFYGSAESGIAFSTQSSGGVFFAYASGIGYDLSKHVDVLLKFQGYGKNSRNIGANAGPAGTVNLRLAYTFPY